MLVALLAAACGSDSTAPSTTEVSGTWSGTYSSAQLGFGRAILNIAQTGTTLNGTWSTAPDPGGGNAIGAGTLGGSITTTGPSGTFVLSLTPSDPRTCPFQATLTVFTAQRQLGGNWVSLNCTVTASGTLLLSKI